LIPQRNISLLSNRLAAGGGLRIREDVLERDYCLAWFLNALAESDLRPVLAFKGGTALKRCYFADYRFSEDLDFTLRQALPIEEIRTRLEPGNPVSESSILQISVGNQAYQRRSRNVGRK
jgi:predicted nucleotidyltransferase component of viral defense system